MVSFKSKEIKCHLFTAMFQSKFVSFISNKNNAGPHGFFKSKEIKCHLFMAMFHSKFVSFISNKKCHKHVTNAPKGIGLAQDTFEER